MIGGTLQALGRIPIVDLIGIAETGDAGLIRRPPDSGVHSSVLLSQEGASAGIELFRSCG